MEQKIFSVDDFSKLTKDEMRGQFAKLGIRDSDITTKVTKARMIVLYRLVLELRDALNKFPPKNAIDARDAIYRRELAEEAGHSTHQWSILSLNGVRFSSIFIHLVHAKFDEVGEPKIKIDDPGGVTFNLTAKAVDEDYTNLSEKISETLGLATAHPIAVKEPEDRLTEVFKYLGDLARNSGADITINFKSTI